MNTSLFLRLRFAFKLSFAVVLALFVGFHLNLETPRWSVLTAAIVAAGPALVAGGEPFSGAIRYRGWLRIIGTFGGCLVGVAFLVLMIRAPFVMLTFGCLWVGFCAWASTMVKVENSYAWGLAGYTALIIVVTCQTTPLLSPQIAIERCSEIVLGILCAILSDILFSPRSIKEDIDRLVDKIIVDQYRLLQLCLSEADRDAIDASWNSLVKSTTQLDGMRYNLMLESSAWGRCNRRLKVMKTLSLSLITQSCESYLITQKLPDRIKPHIKALFAEPVESAQEVHRKLKYVRQFIATETYNSIPVTITSWVGAATRYFLLARGVKTNGSIYSVEEEILQEEKSVRATSPERHHALINGLRAGVSTFIGCLFWLWTGWTAGSGFMIMIAVVTSLAMRTPNPRHTALDFFVGTLVAFPVGAIFYMLIIPSTQQSMLLLCFSLFVFVFIIGYEVQKRRLGSLGTLASTINIIVLSNPMMFHVSLFLDNALGQIIGCFISMVIIHLIRDFSRERTGRTILNRFVYSALSVLTTQKDKRKQNHLPMLYQQLYQLLTMFPGDIAKYRLALNLIIIHQRLREAEIPVSAELSAFHQLIRKMADNVILAKNDVKRRLYFEKLLVLLNRYESLLVAYNAPLNVSMSVQHAALMLKKYQHVLID